MLLVFHYALDGDADAPIVQQDDLSALPHDVMLCVPPDHPRL